MDKEFRRVLFSFVVVNKGDEGENHTTAKLYFYIAHVLSHSKGYLARCHTNVSLSRGEDSGRCFFQ